MSHSRKCFLRALFDKLNEKLTSEVITYKINKGVWLAYAKANSSNKSFSNDRFIEIQNLKHKALRRKIEEG